jgi:hypothetical protein
MKVIGFKRNATPTGGIAIAVSCNYGTAWVDAHNFFAGRRTPVSRREAIRAVQAAPYGRSYYCSAPAGRCYEQTRLLAI